MAIRIRIPVDAPDDILALFGAAAKVRLERSATGGGVGFSEVATATVVSGTTIYALDDAGGDTGEWYRHRYSTTTPTLPEHYGAYSDEYQGGVETGLCSLADVRHLVPNLAATDTSPDEDLLEYIATVTDDIIGYCERGFLPDPATGTKTVYLDYAGDGSTLWLPRGVRSVTYLGVASSDQPGDGTGIYTEITTGYYLDPPEHERSRGWPATRITLGSLAARSFEAGKRTVKLTGAFGWAAPPPRVSQIAARAVYLLWQAQNSPSNALAIASPDGSAIRLLHTYHPKDVEYLDTFRTPVAN